MRDTRKGFITNCHIAPRGDEAALFVVHENGVTPYLDRYAIIPMEEYFRLKEAAGEPVTDGDLMTVTSH